MCKLQSFKVLRANSEINIKFNFLHIFSAYARIMLSLLLLIQLQTSQSKKQHQNQLSTETQSCLKNNNF